MKNWSILEQILLFLDSGKLYVLSRLNQDADSLPYDSMVQSLCLLLAPIGL
jgi:hypothetical protein